MDIATLKADLQVGLSFIERFAPTAEKLGIPVVSTAASVAEVVADTAQAAIDASNAGDVVANTDDLAELQILLAQAQQHRRDLQAQVDAT